MELAALVTAVFLLIVGFLKLKGRARRRAAALNLVLAKATYESLSLDQQRRVKEKAENDLNAMMSGRFRGFNGEYDKFGCYAHAMANLGISPVIKEYPRWFMVDNPIFDITPTDPMIDEVIREIKSKYSLDVSIRKDHRIFDRLRPTADR